jgi:hypothetical protein
MCLLVVGKLIILAAGCAVGADYSRLSCGIWLYLYLHLMVDLVFINTKYFDKYYR